MPRSFFLLIALLPILPGTAAADPQCGCQPIVPLALVLPGDGRLVADCGQSYALHGDSNVRWAPGFLLFPDCAEGACGSRRTFGSDALECQLTNGYSCTTAIGAYVRTTTAVRRGALRDAMAARFAEDTDARNGICAADYRGNGQRVIVVPIVQAFGQVHVARVVGLGAFFLSQGPADGSDAVEGEFLHYVTDGGLLVPGP